MKLLAKIAAKGGEVDEWDDLLKDYDEEVCEAIRCRLLTGGGGWSVRYSLTKQAMARLRVNCSIERL